MGLGWGGWGAGCAECQNLQETREIGWGSMRNPGVAIEITDHKLLRLCNGRWSVVSLPTACPHPYAAPHVMEVESTIHHSSLRLGDLCVSSSPTPPRTSQIGQLEVASLLKFLDGFAIGKLWLCGNHGLQRLLSLHTRSFRAQFKLKAPLQWPTLIQHFPHLQELRLSIETSDSSTSHRMLTDANLATVPRSVQVLELAFGNGSSLLCRPSTAYSSSSFELINLGSEFPHLTELRCGVPSDFANPPFEIRGSSFPRSLLHLSTDLPLPMSPLQIALLPPLLKTLKLSLVEETGMDRISFPCQLENVDISGLRSLAAISMLPATVRTLRVTLHESCTAKTLDDRVSFPPKMKRFTASHWPGFTSWLAAELPASLTEFKYEGEGPLALDLLRHLPSNLSSIDLPRLPLGFKSSTRELKRFALGLKYVSPELNALLPRSLVYPKLSARLLGCIDAINLHGGESTQKNASNARRRIRRLPHDLEDLYVVVCEPSTVSSFSFLSQLKSLRLDLVSQDMDYSARLTWLGSLKALKKFTIASSSRLDFLPTADFCLESFTVLNALPDNWEAAADFNSPALSGLKELTIAFDDNELCHSRPKAWNSFCNWLCARADCNGPSWPPMLLKLCIDVIPILQKSTYDDDGPESDDELSNLRAALLPPKSSKRSAGSRSSRHRWLPLKGLCKLPATLKSLAVQELFPFDSGALRDLPQGLISLKLGAAACVLKDEDLELLPQSLDSLSLPGSPNFDDPADVLNRTLPHIRHTFIKERLVACGETLSNWNGEYYMPSGNRKWKPSSLPHFL